MVVPAGVGKVIRVALGARDFAQRHSGWFGAIGFLLFAGFALYSIATFPSEEVSSFSWWWILPYLVVLAPAMQLANALEFQVQGRMLGEKIGLGEAHSVTLNASMANMAPIPGSIIIRTVRLSRNNDKKQAALTSVIVGLCWLGVSLIIGGVSIFFFSRFFIGSGLLMVGSTLVGVSYRLAGGLERSWPLFFRLSMIQVYLTVVSSLNMYLAFRAIGFEVGAAQVTVVIVSGPLASSVGIFPSGIGLAETIVSVLASLINIPAKVGFLAAALARLNIIVGVLLGKACRIVVSRLFDGTSDGDAPHQVEKGGESGAATEVRP